MPEPRVVAGLHCQQVLALLPDYVEGTLPDETLRQAQAHLAGCSWCARFGGAYAGVVRGLAQGDAGPDLRAALDAALDRPEG